MPNAYCDLTTLRNRLDISGTGNDAALRLLLEAASRIVDNYCRRSFFVETATKYFDGAKVLWALPDLLSVTTFKVDQDGDGTYEKTLAAADYILYPLNQAPKTSARPSNTGDYTTFAADTDLLRREGAYGYFKGVEIVGSWGYGTGLSASPYSLSGTTLNEALDATETGVDVVDGTKFGVGHTILIDSEQMYITGIVTNTLTVVRGVNGTTAATHNTGIAINIYDYPEGIKEAVLMTAARLWKRRDSTYATIVGIPEMGPFEVFRGLDEDVKLMIKPYINDVLRLMVA